MQIFPQLTYNHVFNLGRPNSVSAHVDDIIKAPCDLVVSLWRAVCTITREKVTFIRCKGKKQFKYWLIRWGKKCFWTRHTRIGLTVSLNESLVVIVNSSSHSRPRLCYAQSSRCVVGSHHLPLKKQNRLCVAYSRDTSYLTRYVALCYCECYKLNVAVEDAGADSWKC